MLLKVLFICVLSVTVAAEKKRYDNYTLYKLHPENEDQLEFLKDLYNDDNGLDFWYSPTSVGDFVSVVSPPEMKADFEHKILKRDIRSEIMLESIQDVGDFVSVVSPPEMKADFEHKISKRDIRSEIMLESIQEAMDAQIYSRIKRDTNSREIFWTAFNTYEQIIDWFHHLEETYPDVVTVVHGGESYEGKNITGIKISRGSGRRAFLLEGGQVAADWLSPTVVSYIADQLIRGEDPEARAASEEYDWHIFPVLNPDGLDFSQNAVRTWMKNRRPIGPANIFGVDLTKNWNSQWGISGGSFNPADNNFIGLGPFSEVETRSFSRYIESVGSNLNGMLSFRQFGQRLIIPFAHSSNPMYNYNDMETIGRRAMGSLAVRYGTIYTVGTSRAVYDGATGVLADWVKHRFNPPIVATYQLRDLGTWGYILPVAQVLPSCEETFDSVMAIIREAKHINVL